MNAVHAAMRDGVGRKALANIIAALGVPSHGVHILENPTEELQHDLQRGRRPKLHGMTGGAIGRVEENYLYFTRRFPSNTTNNTIGAGAVAAGDYPFFHIGVQDAGSGAGYFSITTLGLQQTNMPSGGKVPTGRGYQLFDLGVSFNAQAAPGDIAQLLDTMSLSYQKQQSSMVLQHGPLKLWPGGTGLSGFAGAATTVAATTIDVRHASNGIPAMTNVRRFRSPRILSAGENFTYTVTALANTPRSNTAVALSDFTEIVIWLFGRQADKLVS